MLISKPNSELIISHPKFTIEINQQSGFCFGVTNAISQVEQNLKTQAKVYSVGSIVHNSQEVARLANMGLEQIDITDVPQLENTTLLFRAHGEPPESYEKIKTGNNKLIDATCPVVLKIQQRIRKAYHESIETGGQIVIFGKENHAEVIGLMGQTEYNAILISTPDDISKIDFSLPIELFSQTTQALDKLNEIAQIIKSKAQNSFKFNDTICRQVSNREKYLKEFSSRFELIFFVGDPKSSNSKVLFQVCKVTNSNSFFITSENDIDLSLLNNCSKIGICGATSTPIWLMQNVATAIEKLLLDR